MNEQSLERPIADSITLSEEEARLVKHAVVRERVRVGTETVEHVEALQATLHEDEVVVEHVPMGHFVETAPPMRQEGDTTIIPIVKEVVEIRLMLVEEIRITKKVIERNVSQDVRLRSQLLTIEHILPEQPLPQPKD